MANLHPESKQSPQTLDLNGFFVPIQTHPHYAWFEIKLAIPIEMTASLQKDIAASVVPRWRVEQVEMRKLEDGLFALRLSFPASEFGNDANDTEGLRRFRDLITSLIAFSAMAPVELRSKGVFDFPNEDGNRRQISLGPMNYQFPPQSLNDLTPLATGLLLDEKYAPVLHFLWQGLNATHQLYRFINLAIAVEMLVRHDSPISGSRHPKCGKQKCGFELITCPECDGEWTIPATLRERSAFLINDTTVLGAFIRHRNKVFHALSDAPHSDATESLYDLNAKLALTIRNYLGSQMGLPPISSDRLSIALNPPEVAITVFYTNPS